MNTNTTPIVITDVVDRERGCGWRKEGGLYLRSEGLSRPCGKLPFKLDVCPCCNHGIKHKIGWSWINPRMLFAGKTCTRGTKCGNCPLATPPETAGLIWVGRSFYPTTKDFTIESNKMGVSRRIHNVPKGFKLGETIVFFAHKDAITEACPCKQPDLCADCEGEGQRKVAGIFHACVPSAIEYVVTGKESKKLLREMIDKGITLVRVKHAAN